MDTESIFSSDITRGCVPNTKDLYDLINIVPANSVKPRVETVKTINFQPKSGKLYVPKRKSKLKVKVKTVRNIRFDYEKDVMSYLPQDLEKQQKALLKKIRRGSSQNESTKEYAQNLLKSNKPVSRQSWQMLMKLNPENKPYPIQYVLWNGYQIRLNGSKGGRKKFLLKYDLQKKVPVQSKFPFQQQKFTRQSNKNKLLENSVNVKFRAGPLSKKINLDESYQKHQLGRTELVKLPTPVLEVCPSTYGITFDVATRSILNSLRDSNGGISENWASLATTALGTVKNGKLEKVSPGTCISFELQYKKNQKHILLRKGCCETEAQSTKQTFCQNQDSIESVVNSVITSLLDSVEINLQQDVLAYDEDDIREIGSDISINSTKEKNKKKFTELDRLHVTVIELPNETSDEKSVKCENYFCKLGCICSSLKCRKILRGHCGRLQCMFSCKCDHSMYNIDSNHSEMLNELVSLDNEICSKLAKEEKKFHQTVVLSGEQSILLKSKRRDSKAHKKYDDFYYSIKNKIENHKHMSVVTFKLDCKNVEPWCMVHNLYKCFCGGQFVEAITLPSNEDTQDITVDEEVIKITDTSCKRERKNTVLEKSQPDSNTKKTIDSVPLYTIDSESSSGSFADHYLGYECSRLKPYAGRKYNDSYYSLTNSKILGMEQNDQIIHKRLMSLVFKAETIPKSPTKKPKKAPSKADNKDESCNSVTENKSPNFISNENDNTAINKVNALPPPICIIDSDPETTSDEQKASPIKNNAEKTVIDNTAEATKSSLIRWLENSYKVYKKRLDEGIVKNSLDPPKQGVMALYPWDFLLTRYRENKNLFLVTKARPFRIFMAVSMKHPFFKNCINIDDIRFTDLNQYPITIKNLLTNVTNLVDHFYIFRGLSFCWELIGSVSKITDKNSEMPETNSDVEQQEDDNSTLTFEDDDMEGSNSVSSVQFNNVVLTDDAGTNIIQKQLSESNMESNINQPNLSAPNESSRWFVMTLENDFSEIQLYKKGFFVKYESIIKAIRVSRLSGNTVRLSSQRCLEQGGVPPFGIYAIPSTEEYNVFIGPYENDEPLGIETVKTMLDNKKSKRTRGVWITTDKVDNLKVISKPLGFIPDKDTNQMVQLYDDDQNVCKESETSGLAISHAEKSILTQNLINENAIIAEATDFSSVILSKHTDVASANRPALTDNVLTNRSEQSTMVASGSYDAGTSSKKSNYNKLSKPIAEIAPQIKIIPDVTKPKTATRRPESGMFILKPEEINKKAMEQQLLSVQNAIIDDTDSCDEMSADIENFLATSIVCTPPKPLDLFDTNKDAYSDVWIECLTVNLGWIPGRRRSDGFLSVEFPGFKKSPFYEEEIAFDKLNQVLERKVYIQKGISLKWRVVTNEKDLISKDSLLPCFLGPDFILTKSGLKHKRVFLTTKSQLNMTDSSFEETCEDAEKVELLEENQDVPTV